MGGVMEHHHRLLVIYSSALYLRKRNTQLKHIHTERKTVALIKKCLDPFYLSTFSVRSYMNNVQDNMRHDNPKNENGEKRIKVSSKSAFYCRNFEADKRFERYRMFYDE